MNDPRRRTVETVLNALRTWDKATTIGKLNAEAALQAGGRAVRLIVRNIAVLRELAREFGADPVTLSILGSVLPGLERLSDVELEERGSWGWHNCICVTQFIGDLSHWMERIDTPQIPDDLISSAVAVQDFWVSRATLQRSVRDGTIHDYRPPNAKRNSPFKLSRREIAGCFPRRK